MTLNLNDLANWLNRPLKLYYPKINLTREMFFCVKANLAAPHKLGCHRLIK